VPARQTPMTRGSVRFVLLVVFILMVVVAACGDDDGTAEAETTAPSSDVGETGVVEVRRTPGIDYTGTGSFRRMDIWAPTAPGEWPSVVVVPGVGQQSKASFQPLAQTIAEQGAVVFVIDIDDSVPFITAIQQAACAVRYADAHTAEYGGDPGNIVIVGNSMGASVASVVALAGDSFPGPCAVEGGSAHVEAFVGFEGAYDYVRESDYLMVDHRYLEDEDPELYAAIDPYTHLDDNPDLAVRLIHGVDDDVLWYDVPPGESVAFGEALSEHGCPCDVTLLEGSAAVDLMRADSEAFDAVVEATMEVAAA